MKQKCVADALGVDETTIYNWENNRVMPAIRYIPRIVRFLGYVPYRFGESLAERIKAARTKSGLSQKKYARLIGVNQSSLADWERGARKPSGKSLLKIEAFLR